MERLEITKDTPTPAGGRIVKDDAGELTGIFIDTAEERLVIDRIPTPSDAEYLSLF